MRGAGNYLPRGVNETNDVRRWRALSTLTQQRFRVVLSFASLFSLRLIILNHNHARSSRRSDRLRFIAGINVWHASQPCYIRAARIPFALHYYYTSTIFGVYAAHCKSCLFVRILFIFIFHLIKREKSRKTAEDKQLDIL